MTNKSPTRLLKDLTKVDPLPPDKLRWIEAFCRKYGIDTSDGKYAVQEVISQAMLYKEADISLADQRCMLEYAEKRASETAQILKHPFIREHISHEAHDELENTIIFLQLFCNGTNARTRLYSRFKKPGAKRLRMVPMRLDLLIKEHVQSGALPFNIDHEAAQKLLDRACFYANQPTPPKK